MELFRNRYRTDSNRLRNWDYTSQGVYFITICTLNKIHYFGTIQNAVMSLSEIGSVAHQFILDIPTHSKGTSIEAVIVMPNHVHILLRLKKSETQVQYANNVSEKGISDEDIYIDVRKTSQHSNATTEINEFMSQISPKANSVSAIIRSYKGAVTKEVRKINPDFSWQVGFHDHIVSNDTTYHMIKNYIISNPKNWVEDKLY